MKRQRRHYSEQDRQRGLAALAAVGGRAELAAIALGVPRKTVERWREMDERRQEQGLSARDQDRFVALRRKSERDIERGLLRVITHGLKRLNSPKAWAAAGVKDAAIATGIAHTHLRLLRTQTTALVGHVDLAAFLRGAGYVPGAAAPPALPPGGVHTDPGGQVP